MNEYQKFKKLLEYFVAHLEYVVLKDTNGRGYNEYIKSLVDNNNFKIAGQGYNGGNIQNQIKDWANYVNGKICINIDARYPQRRGCYLNWERTWLNVFAEWKDNKVSQLVIAINPSNNAEGPKREELKTTLLSQLGLFDNQPPLNILKSFFDEFEKLIIEHNRKEKTNKDMETIKPYVDLLTTNQNLILTGAPGTGKTYLAKQIAEAMNAEWTFGQFHPSYDYTDFVEGLRPTPPDEKGNIGFERKDGVFKEFCKRALENLLDSKKSLAELQNKSNIEKKLDDFLTNAIENETEFEYKNKTNKFVIIPHSREEYFYAKILNNETMEKQIVAKKDVIKVLEKANEVQKPTDIQRIFNTRFKYQYTFIFLILEKLRADIKSKTIQSVTQVKKKDFVFIIDEINRGEISKIFGELFFAIDPSYRGTDGKVQTQYANLIEDGDVFKDGFYVPENVYVIGTMNDIDRSVESFDFAMRRRFTWKEITAEESQKMFDGETWKDEAIKRMNALNSVIFNIQGLGSAYHIGAAYFKNNLPKYSDNQFENLWNYHLKTLLFEYLRGMPEPKKELEKLESAYKPKSTSDENNG